ncbi:MAG: hypothetical protein ACFCU9_02810 [Cyanophyceae cyanobacterium]
MPPQSSLNENEIWIKPPEDNFSSIASGGALIFAIITIVALITRNIFLVLISSPLCVVFGMGYFGYRKSGRIIQVRALKHIYRNGSEGSIEYQRLRSSCESDHFISNKYIIDAALWFLKTEGIVDISDDGSLILFSSETVENSDIYKDLSNDYI